MLTDLQTRKLTKLFSMYDEGSEGFLVKKDFETITKRLAAIQHCGPRSPRYVGLSNQLMADWKGLNKAADTDKDRKVSIDEWLRYYDEVLSVPQQFEKSVKSLMEMIFDIFTLGDQEGINLENWGKLLSVYNVSPVYAPLIFPSLDTSETGIISREQMLTLIHDFFYSNEADTPANSMFGPF